MLAYLFVLIAVAVRLGVAAKVVSLPFGFTPLGASMLFAGAKLPAKQRWIPLAALVVCDLALTRVLYAYPFTWDQLITWGCYAGVIAMGTLLARNASLLRVAGLSVASSVGFFVITNLAVFFAWETYPKTLSGLALCYTMALPFFRNGLTSDVIFAVTFFSIPVAIEIFRSKAARERA